MLHLVGCNLEICAPKSFYRMIFKTGRPLCKVIVYGLVNQRIAILELVLVKKFLFSAADGKRYV